MKGAVKKFFKNKKIILGIGVGIPVLVLALFPLYKQDILGLVNFKDEQSRLTMQELRDREDLSGVAQAAGGLPWQFGGTVTKYTPVCTVDNQSGTCPSSCPMCTQMVAQACNGYQEIQYQPAVGSMPSTPPGTVCVPKGFKFQGGMPTSGSQILGGGASPQLPWVIGVSSL